MTMMNVMVKVVIMTISDNKMIPRTGSTVTAKTSTTIPMTRCQCSTDTGQPFITVPTVDSVIVAGDDDEEEEHKQKEKEEEEEEDYGVIVLAGPAGL